ncbi:terminase small subunit [Arthrobacter phage Snek]|uniref:Terminase small subunit n=1 Tax=Arthrobacter phage Tweety19 TaxID=2768133 RepID=A0A7G9W200_9CAUD|nr:terminase small subunit [Arthrobacter phage Tweety19]QNO12663.1 terminase small subunit [Arthrobacter phage Tweety19]
MAGRGPAPKLQHQRERDTKRRQADAVSVTFDGVLRGPELPASIPDPHPETVEWWTTWRVSPQAQLFEPTDWEALKRAALLHDYVWKSTATPGGKPSAAAISELRLIEERYGATFVDRQRAKIHIAREEQGEAEVVQLHAVNSRADVMARMRGDK